MIKQRIGFIGQGFVGKHMADDYEARGYDIVRYALEDPYQENRAKLQNCNIVFVAVPTPTTPQGFDSSIVSIALESVSTGTIAVIKSTIVPGTTQALQRSHSNITVMHSPEFLREKTAAHDTANPERNIIGICADTVELRTKAAEVLKTLPVAPYSLITLAVNAECVKYIGNAYLYAKLLFMNIAYDFTNLTGADWGKVHDAVIHDSRIGISHTQPVNDGVRGAGGHCFIKDFEAFIETFECAETDQASIRLLRAMRAKNNQLLVSSEKDLELLYAVYGHDIPTA